MLKTSAEGVEFVFSVMDLTIVLLIMIVTIIWFRSKYIERFYDACKSGDLEVIAEYLDTKGGVI